MLVTFMLHVCEAFTFTNSAAMIRVSLNRCFFRVLSEQPLDLGMSKMMTNNFHLNDFLAIQLEGFDMIR